MAYRKDWAAVPQVAADGYAGAVKMPGRRVTLTADDIGTAGNTIGVFTVPAGFVITGCLVVYSAMEGGPDVTAPTITSGSTASVAENVTLAHSLTANETVTWSIVGGADLARFELSGSTLRWLSNGTKDFETPDDADTNNAYIVQVRATDLASNTTNQTITVTVTDVSEGGGGGEELPYFPVMFG